MDFLSPLLAIACYTLVRISEEEVFSHVERIQKTRLHVAVLEEIAEGRLDPRSEAGVRAATFLGLLPLVLALELDDADGPSDSVEHTIEAMGAVVENLDEAADTLGVSGWCTIMGGARRGAPMLRVVLPCCVPVRADCRASPPMVLVSAAPVTSASDLQQVTVPRSPSRSRSWWKLFPARWSLLAVP